MEIEFSPSAMRDIEQWKLSGDKKSIEKISVLLEANQITNQDLESQNL